MWKRLILLTPCLAVAALAEGGAPAAPEPAAAIAKPSAGPRAATGPEPGAAAVEPTKDPKAAPESESAKPSAEPKAAPAPAGPNQVRVWCSESCVVKVDGQSGRRVTERFWVFKAVRPGSRRVEATTVFGRRLHADYAAVPERGGIGVRLSDARLVVGSLSEEELAEDPAVPATAALLPGEGPAPRGGRVDGSNQPRKGPAVRPEASGGAALAEEPGRGPAVPPKRMKIAVLRLTARTGLDPSVVDLFTDTLVGELRKHPGKQVVTSGDLAAALGIERERQLLGCSDATCLAEIAGSLGVDYLMHGSAGRVGKSLVVVVALVDARKAVAVASVSERLKSTSDEAFFDALPEIVAALLAQVGG